MSLGRGAWLGAFILVGLPGGTSSAAVSLYQEEAAFLAAAGAVHLEDFAFASLVGGTSSGGVSLLPFDGFRVRAAPAALKLRDVPEQGNHSTSSNDFRYLTADTDSLGQSATVTLEFEPPIDRLGFWVVDLDSFPLGVTVLGEVFSIPPTENGGEAFFGILSSEPIHQVVLAPIGSDNHYSLDDVQFNVPPTPEDAGEIPVGSTTSEPLSLTLLGDGSLFLSWFPSCASTDDDYEVYEGKLAPFDLPEAKLCSTAKATSAILAPGAGSRYYLVVPRNLTREGSYGRLSGGGPRPRPVSACLLQAATGCP